MTRPPRTVAGYNTGSVVPSTGRAPRTAPVTYGSAAPVAATPYASTPAASGVTTGATQGSLVNTVGQVGTSYRTPRQGGTPVAVPVVAPTGTSVRPPRTVPGAPTTPVVRPPTTGGGTTTPPAGGGGTTTPPAGGGGATPGGGTGSGGAGGGPIVAPTDTRPAGSASARWTPAFYNQIMENPDMLVMDYLQRNGMDPTGAGSAYYNIASREAQYYEPLQFLMNPTMDSQADQIDWMDSLVQQRNTPGQGWLDPNQVWAQMNNPNWATQAFLGGPELTPAQQVENYNQLFQAGANMAMPRYFASAANSAQGNYSTEWLMKQAQGQSVGPYYEYVNSHSDIDNFY